MAKRESTAPNGAEQGPGKYGHIAFIAGVCLILFLGLFLVWPSDAPYHPEWSGDAITGDDSATRFDGTLLD